MTKSKECLFCQIIEGLSPSYKVYEDNYYLAFLDSKPIREGHILLVPKEHFDYVFDMPDEGYLLLFGKAKDLSHSLQRALNAQRIGLLISGIAIPHVHLHLLPVFEKGDLDPNLAKYVTQPEL